MENQLELEVDALQLLDAEQEQLLIVKCTYTCGGQSCNVSCGASCYATS